MSRADKYTQNANIQSFKFEKKQTVKNIKQKSKQKNRCEQRKYENKITKTPKQTSTNHPPDNKTQHNTAAQHNNTTTNTPKLILTPGVS